MESVAIFDDTLDTLQFQEPEFSVGSRSFEVMVTVERKGNCKDEVQCMLRTEIITDG